MIILCSKYHRTMKKHTRLTLVYLLNYKQLGKILPTTNKKLQKIINLGKIKLRSTNAKRKPVKNPHIDSYIETKNVTISW